MSLSMEQPDPARLFKGNQQQPRNPPQGRSVSSQLQERPALPGSLPAVNTTPVEAIPSPAAPPPDPVQQLVSLSQSGAIKKLRAAYQQKQQNPVHQLVDLSSSGALAALRLEKQNRDYQQALTDHENRTRNPLNTMYDAGGVIADPPNPPRRSLEQIERDWNKGVENLRGSEWGWMLQQLESGSLTPEQEGTIAATLEPKLSPDARKQLQIARLTRDKLEAMREQAKADNQLAQSVEPHKRTQAFMQSYNADADPGLHKTTERASVLGREFVKGLSLNYAFAPDEERLNSDDAEIASDERARRAFYQGQSAEYPVTSFVGNVLGAAPHFYLGNVALSKARMAGAKLGLASKGQTAESIAANRAILANRGQAQTTAGKVAMGAAEGLAYDLLSRPEGSEDMSLAENLKARAQQVGFGVALGSALQFGAIKAGDLWKLAKDKQLERQLKKEAASAGYGSNVDSYINDLIEVEFADDGRSFASAKKEPISDLPDLDGSGHVLSKQNREQPPGERYETADIDNNTETAEQPPDTGTPDEPKGTTGTETLSDAAPGTKPVEPPGTNQTQESVQERSRSTVADPGAAKPTEKVVTKQGMELDVGFVLADADDLTTSHTGNGVVNPDYPEALQPRDRSKITSDAQIQEIARTLKPEWLGSSPKATDGAPIVSPDGIVESGNGRIMALRMAYAQGDEGRSGQYRQWLKDNAERFGIDPGMVDKLRKPVLVRKRLTNVTDDDLIRFTREANDRDQASLSPTEQARVDALRLTDEDVLMFSPGANGDMTADSNMNFLHRFVQRIGIEDTAGLTDANNRPNQNFVQRAQAAIFKKAYDDDRLLSLMSETTAADLKGEAARNMVAALNRAAPAFARAKSLGSIPDESNFIPNLVEAVNLVRQSRRDNQALSEIIGQQSFLDTIDPVTEQLARFFDVNLRSAQRMGDVLNNLGQQLEQEAMKGGADMFSSAPGTKQDFINATNRNMEGTYGEKAPIIPDIGETNKRQETGETGAATEGGSETSQSAGSGRTETDNAGYGETGQAEGLTIKGKPVKVANNPDGTISANGKKIPKSSEYVPNTHVVDPPDDNSSGTLYSNPITFAIQSMARSLNLGESAAAGFGGGVYGGIASHDQGNDIGSSQWWLDVLTGAGAGAFALGSSRYLGIHGKDSFLDKFITRLGEKWETLPLVGRGSSEIRKLKKQQQLMLMVINRQTGEMGEFLAKNFTPQERSEMADMIENRGYFKQAGVVARQARELDEFISYTSERMKDLGMLPADLETGGYIHRYYEKHLNLDGDKSFKAAKKQSLSGSYTIGRGTVETFKPEYLSQAVREKMAEYDRIKNRIDQLESSREDMFNAPGEQEIEDLRLQLAGMKEIELREYVGIQNGKPHAFIFMPDEVPAVPNLDTTLGLPVPLESSDRSWRLRGTDGNQPVLWRDWTREERTRWGEITDAGYRFVRGQAEVAHDLSMATLFKKISDKPDWVSDTPKITDGQEWRFIPVQKVNKNSPLTKYGALSGKYVKPEVYRAIKHYNQPLFGRGKVASLYRGLLNRWKLFKTVYNPVSHFNNTVSNVEMLYMAGYSPHNLGNAIAEMKAGEDSEYWREARDFGLFGSDWGSSIIDAEGNSGSLADLAETLRNQPDITDAEQVIDSVDTVMKLKTWLIESRNAVKNADTKLASGAALADALASPAIDLMKKPIKAATDSAKWLYRKEDEVFKMAAFIEERKKGATPSQAVDAANRFFFDYNSLPDAVRWMRDSPLGSPFISYTYLAIPAMVRNAVERPERMLALAAAFEAVNFAGLKMDEQLEEQGYWDRMDAENTMNPPWMKGRASWGALNNLHIPGDKPGIDSYKISLANAHALGNIHDSESGKDLPLWPNFMSFWGPDPVGGNPWTRIPYDIIFNTDWKGSPIYGKSDDLPEILKKSTKYAYQAIFPTMPLFPGSWHQNKVIEGVAGGVLQDQEAGIDPNPLAESLVSVANSMSEALGGKQFTGADWRGNQFKTSDSLLGSVGVKWRIYRPRDLYQYQINKIRRDIFTAQKDYSRKKDRGYTESQREQFKAEHEKNMATLKQKLKELKEAYQSIR